eukprot:SM000127S26649  [mRNA]  locus=s127:248946:250355:- [translate_table: standard]
MERRQEPPADGSCAGGSRRTAAPAGLAAAMKMLPIGGGGGGCGGGGGRALPLAAYAALALLVAAPYVLLTHLVLAGLECAPAAGHDFPAFEDVLARSSTDKRDHGYGHMYGPYFDALVAQRRRVAFLEIGLRAGASLSLWKEFFPQARIYGLDHGKIWNQFVNDSDHRVHIFLGDQGDRTFLTYVVAQIRGEVGELDFIIDDGGHTMDQQITSFSELMPLVRPGGWYFIEDLETSYYGEPCTWGCYGKCCGGGPPGKNGTTVSLIKSFIDVLNEDFIAGPPHRKEWGQHPYNVNPSDHYVASIQCWRNMCGMQRKNPESRF